VAEVQVEAGNSIASLREAAERLGRGEQLVVCVSSVQEGDAVRGALLTALGARELVGGVLPGKTPPEAVTAAKKTLASHPRRKYVLVALTAGDQPWHRKASGLLEFHEKLSAFFEREGTRSVWILLRPLLPDSAIGKLKDIPRFVADLSNVGGALYCQFITAKGTYAPSFFFPRKLHLSNPDLPLDPASLPASDASASVVDLLQEPYRELFNQVHEGIVLFNLGDGTAQPNPRAVEMLGYDANGLSAVPLRNLVTPDAYRTALRHLVALRRKKKVSAELELRRRSGRTFVAAISASVMADRRAVVILRDISDGYRVRKELRAAGGRLTAIADGSPLPQVIFAGRKLVFANRMFRTVFNWVDTLSGDLTIRDFFGKKNTAAMKLLTGSDGAAPAEAYETDAVFETPSGNRLEVIVSASRTLWEEKDAWHFSFTDVTARNDAVRGLRESEKTYGQIIDHQAGAVSVVQDGRLVLLNKAFAEMFGYASELELLGKEASAPVSSRGRKEFLEQIAAGVSGKTKDFLFEYNAKKGDGPTRVIELRGRCIHYGGKPAIVCHHTDISGRRKLEEELRRQSREYNILAALSHDLHLSLEPVEVMTSGMSSAMKWLGFERGGVYGLEPDGSTLTLVINESLSDNVAAALRVQHAGEGTTGLAMKTAEPQLLDVAEYPPYLPYKSLFEAEGIRTVLYLPLLSGEAVNGLMMFCSAREPTAGARDNVLLASISRHAGDALENALRFERVRSSELRYRTALESVPDVIYQATPAGAFTLLSPQVERLLGYTPDEFFRNPDLWRAILHADDRTEYSRRISDQGVGKDEFEIGYRLVPKGKAAYRHVREAIRYGRDRDGNLTGITGIVSDVTERVGAEQVLTARTLVTDVLQSLQEGVVVYDRELRYREWNRAMELITGYTRENVLERSAFDGEPRFELSDFPDLLHRALAGDPVSSEDVHYTRPGTNETLVLWCRFSPLRDKDGSIAGVAGTVTDVTNRKSLEREIRESEETLRNVIDTMGDALMISDLQGKVWEVNREFSNLTGLSRGEVIGTTFPYPWLIEEEMSRFVVWLAALREKKFMRDFDMTWRRHDGHDVPISLNTSLLRNALGEPVAMLNLARDISERHRLAGELSGKSRQIEMLNRIISKANSTEQFSPIFDVIAEEVRALVPYDHMNVCLLSDDRLSLVVHAAVGMENALPQPGTVVPVESTVSRLSVGDRRAVVIGRIPDAGTTLLGALAGMQSEISIPIVLNERILGTFNVSSASLDAFTGNELSYLQPIADQIGALIDRTQLFQRVSDDSAYIHNLLDSIESVVFTVDQTSTVREVNTAWRDFAVVQGTPDLRDESSVIGKSLESIIGPYTIRVELMAVVPRLFDGTLNEFSREFELGKGESGRCYQLAVTPMAVNGRVTGLVFTYTDITYSKRTEAEIKRQNAELVALNAVASAINKSLDTKSILSVVHEELHRSLSFDLLMYFAVDAVGGAHRLQFEKGSGDDALRASVASHAGLLSAAGGKAFAGGIPRGGSLLAVPVFSKGAVMGVLALAGGDPDAGAHLRLLESIANLIEIAMDRALLYEDIVAKAEEIQERNKELDDFTYVVSHDLKEPLITIEGYSKIVLDDYRDVVDEEGKGYLTSVVQSSQRMKSLIDDLLTLSRIGRVSEMQVNLPLAAVIGDALRDFEFSLKESHAEVNVPAGLPFVRYNRTQLGMVFRNLIANAIKFNRSPAPRIDITVNEADIEHVVAVRDNGIGIEKQHHERIFIIFQRLHRSEDFRGTGAGLTIVKKIVENHGGRIWVESALGEGTTFYFTIPK